MSTLSTRERLERAVAWAIDERIEEIRNTPLSERRSKARRQGRRRLTIKREFPFIGRGNVISDYLVTREEADAELRRALR